MFQDIRHAAKTAAADPFAVLIKGDRPRKTFLNLHTQASICKNDLVFAVFDLRFFVCHMKSEVRSSVTNPFVMKHLHADDIFERSRKSDRKQQSYRAYRNDFQPDSESRTPL
jgi:hypothetical protein